ncbi:MAG: tyrosine-type recombinase/integrase [Acidobacteriaceae bacterium]|nr:tyrosine-type recombinase/integrase [Acidobacteriaceae bacterium]
MKISGVASFVPYSLRHTCLTRWANAGMNPFNLQYLAGHENIATTLRYIHLARMDAQEKLREVR